MFSTPAFAQTATNTAAQGGMAGIVNLVVPMALVLGIFYILVLRPQKRQLNEHRARIAAVKKGDTVVTGGGLVGKVTKVDEQEVEVEIAANTRVRAVKSTLADVRQAGGRPAND